MLPLQTIILWDQLIVLGLKSSRILSLRVMESPSIQILGTFMAQAISHPQMHLAPHPCRAAGMAYLFRTWISTSVGS